MKIDFQFESKYGIFSDALQFEDGAVPDEATIESMKRERFDAWLYNIENPPVEEVPEENLEEGA